MGLMYKESEIDDAILYCANMLKDERIITINKDGEIYAVMFFSITDSADEFLIKKTWEYRPHHPEGRVIYVEKIVSKGWDKELRSILERVARTKHPQIEYGIWHKWAKWGDRMVITKRRLLNV